jgi:hypothetical protein
MPTDTELAIIGSLMIIIGLMDAARIALKRATFSASVLMQLTRLAENFHLSELNRTFSLLPVRGV